ncbi:MAG TPA: hypothetical protein VJO12_05935 [Stellaceae bacterium]|nr:hypothetical protein [Stellaceae bacterium]
MKNALALAALLALVTSPATAACYGGPAVQTCNDLDGDRSTGITTMRGYNAQSGSRWNETVTRPRKMTDSVMTNGHGSAHTNQTESRRQELLYTCTPYGGCR